MKTPPRAPIRSFVKRQGRLTRGQRRAIEALWPKYGLAADVLLMPEAIFGRQAPLGCEIGFGMGGHLAEMAAHHPEMDFIGIDVYEPGVGTLMNKIEAQGLTNIRIYCADAVEVLKRCIANGILAQIHILFPDPWPKKRHHKRRLIQPAFVNGLIEKLATAGILHLATDWQNYAEYIQGVLDQNPRLIKMTATAQAQQARTQTKFESRGLKLGHEISEFYYQKK